MPAFAGMTFILKEKSFSTACKELTMKNKVYISSINNDFQKQILAAFEWIGWKRIIKKDSRVFIKPNFTFPFYKPGITTSPRMIEAILSVLSQRTSNISIGETDGCGGAWKVEDAFEGHDLPEICKRYNANLVNLCNCETETVEIKLKGKTIHLDLPRLLLEDTDVFISVPVPKIHCMTKVSLGLKNQWGCIPLSKKRFIYHHCFDELVCRLNKVLKTKIVIGDCMHMLTGNGPMFGDEIKMDMMVASNDLGSFELTMLKLMGLDGGDIGHINEAGRLGIIPESIDSIQFNTDWTSFVSDKFFLKRTIQNYIALVGFKSRFITWLGYESPISGLLHKVLYALKGNPLQKAVNEHQKHEH